MKYDPTQIRSFFDEYGNAEWERLVSSPKNLMSLQIHQYYLSQYLSSSDRILEVGAGAGRYSIFMSRLGASILVSDISSVQLDLAQQHITEAGLASQVEDYQLLDSTDLSSLADSSFDAVVAIGGPLSYVLDERDQAMKELIRVTKPGGLVFLGMMSRYGALQRLVGNYSADLIADDYTVQEVLATGDDPGYLAYSGHHSHLFTYDEITEFLQDFPVEIIEATANSYLTNHKGVDLSPVVESAAAWQKLFEMDLQICKEIVDGGSHMLLVVQKTS